MKVRCQLFTVSLILFGISFQAYLQGGSWTLTTPMESPRISYDSGVVLPDGRAVFASWAADGSAISAAVYLPTERRWLATGEMSHPGAAAVLLNETVLSVSRDSRVIALDTT